MTGRHQNPPADLLARYGCTAPFWRKLRDIGLKMIGEGASKDATPLRAFSHQRTAALNVRGIGWELTLPQWWGIWTLSGHWHERGVGRGYMMCRNGDVGPYAVGNVFIGPGAENLSIACRKNDLPIGVSFNTTGKGKPYRASCWIGGKQRHLGLFETPWQAHAAYLKGVEFDVATRAPAQSEAA